MVEIKQKECIKSCKENGTKQIEKVTVEEWKLLEQYRNFVRKIN